MNLIIDIGNTTCKFAIYDDNHLIFNDKTKSESDAVIKMAKDTAHDFDVKNCIISSVSLPSEPIAGAIEGLSGAVMTLRDDIPLPIANLYATPKTLGKDRIAAAVGATVLFPSASCLIIDAGTAITYDYVKDGCQYLGGNISPGIDIRFKSLHDFTSRLPLITVPHPTDGFGLTTEEALSNGVINGVIHEINGYIDAFEKKNVNSRIILTGGSSIYLCKKLKNTIFAEPNLVTIGLNRILNYNVLKEN